MVETNNMFEVTMGKVTDEYGNLNEESSKYYTQALSFQNEMNEKLATNKSELEKFQSMYYNMFKSQGINKDASYLMSESLTKAGYDIASLYNLSTEDAMNKIKSGIAGQVESLRTIGIDVSESSLGKVLNEVGIDRTVTQLSYAEKEVARYIAIIEQAGVAQGDFAKTFESPANQIRVFQNQLMELKQVAGSFIMNAFGGIIVWANAIIMAIKEILKSIASVFGYNLDTGGADLSDTTGITGLNDGLSGASKKAKELKKQLMGFDEINNIDPNSTTKGSSTGTATGIDDKLLNSLKEWDNKMSSISGKAQEIRDAILDWLGLSDGIPKTFQEWWNKLGNIQKILLVIAGIIGGIYLIGKISKLIKWIGSLWTILKTGQGATTTFGEGLSVIGKIINGLKTGFSNFGSWISMVVEQYKIFRSQGNGVIDSLKLTNKSLKDTNQGFMDMIPTGVKVVAGLAGLVASTALTYKSMDDLKKGSINTGEAVAKLGVGIAGAAASGALLGSVIPGIGTALGAIIGAIVGAVGGIIGFSTAIDNSRYKTSDLKKELDNLTSSYKQTKQSIEDSSTSQIAELQCIQDLSKGLEEMIDSNGKVKVGYEERAKIILGELSTALGKEYKLTDNNITINGELVKSYDDIQKSVEDTIEAKKKEIKLEASKESLIEATKEEAKAKNQVAKAQQNLNDKITKYKQNPWNIIDANAVNEAKTHLDEAKNALTTAQSDVETFNDDFLNNVVATTGEFSSSMVENGQLTADTLKTLAKDNSNAFLTELNKMDEGTQSLYLGLATTSDSCNPQLIAKWKELGEKSEGEYLSSLSASPADTQATILSSITTVDNMNDGMKTAWSNLAIDSKDEFNNALSSLPDDVQGQILASTIAVTGMTDTTETAYNNLSDNGKTAFNNAMAGLDTDARNKVQSAIDEINKKQRPAGEASGNVGTTIHNDFKDKTGDTKKTGENFLQGFIDVISTGNPLNLFGILGRLANKVVTKWKEGLDEHSPSKATRESALFFVQGFTDQMDKSSVGMLKQVKNIANDVTNGFSDNINFTDTYKELSGGIKVNSKALEVDTNQYVDYGSLSGSIQAQSNVTMGQNIIQGIATAVSQAMHDTNINVNVEARTDEGVIVKKVSQGLTDIVTQTGELPFPVPV